MKKITKQLIARTRAVKLREDMRILHAIVGVQPVFITILTLINV